MTKYECAFTMSRYICSTQGISVLGCSTVNILLLQVLCHREDPRLREQEWGNFQVPSKMADIMKERRRTGAFYYRFPTGERCA